jgi:hypothetical protein
MRPFWLALLLLAPACRPPATGPVYLSRGMPFTLRSPGTGPRFFASQEVVFHRPGEAAETMLTTVESDGQRLSLVASSPLGMTLFTIQVKDGATAIDARVPLPPQLDPRLLPAMVQLANWPLDDLRRGLAKGTELIEEGPKRTLLRKGKVVLTLVRDGQEPPYRTVVLTLPALGITLDIRTLEDKP